MTESLEQSVQKPDYGSKNDFFVNVFVAQAGLSAVLAWKDLMNCKIK